MDSASTLMLSTNATLSPTVRQSSTLVQLLESGRKDTETILNSVKKTNRLITVEESWPFGSVGSEIANIVQRDAFDYLDSPVIKVNSADVPMPYALSLEKLYLPQVDDIINAAKKVSYIK